MEMFLRCCVGVVLFSFLCSFWDEGGLERGVGDVDIYMNGMFLCLLFLCAFGRIAVCCGCG